MNLKITNTLQTLHVYIRPSKTFQDPVDQSFSFQT